MILRLVLLALVMSVAMFTIHDLPVPAAPSTPKPPASVFQPSERKIAPLEVAKVFGRAKGCENASPELIQAVAAESLFNSIDARIAAATVAIESACNPYAVSVRGAVGLMQVTPRTWGEKFDFSKTYNLLNLHDNVHVGVSILSDMIHTYGVREGVRRYQGLGVGCDTCDGAYTDKIMNLAVR